MWHMLTEFCHKKKQTTAILSLPLIQVGQVSVTGEVWALSAGLPLRKPAQEQCGKVNWPRSKCLEQ